MTAPHHIDGHSIPYDLMRAALFRANAQCLATWDGPNNAKRKGSARSSWSEMELWLIGNETVQRTVILQRWIETGGFDAYIQITEHKTDKAIEEVIGCTRVDSRVKPASYIAELTDEDKRALLETPTVGGIIIERKPERSAADLTLMQRIEAHLSGCHDHGTQPFEGWPGLLADLRAAIGINTPLALPIDSKRTQWLKVFHELQWSKIATEHGQCLAGDEINALLKQLNTGEVLRADVLRALAALGCTGEFESLSRRSSGEQIDAAADILNKALG